MKIALLYEGLNPENQFIGGSLYLLQFRDKLREKGFAPSLFDLNYSIQETKRKTTQKIFSTGLISIKPVKVLVTNQLIFNRMKLLKEFDIIHSISWSSIPAIYYISKYSSTQFIFDCRTSLMNINRYYNIYKLAVLKNFEPNYLIFCDEGSYKQYLNIFNNKRVVYIPTPIDTYSFKKNNRTDMSPKFRILFASSLSSKKGLLDLLKVMEDLSTSYKEIQLVIAGDGPLREYVLNIAAKKKWLIYVGLVEHSRMPLLLNSVDLLVHPSHFEGLSRTVLEALACEIPVIATNVGGHFVLRNVLKLVPPSSPQQLNDAILYLFENEKVRKLLGVAGRKFVKKNNSWDMAIQRTISIYELLNDEKRL